MHPVVHTLRMGRSCMNVITASLLASTTACPLGLFMSLATLAKVTLGATPTEHVSWVAAVTLVLNSAATCSGRHADASAAALNALQQCYMSLAPGHLSTSATQATSSRTLTFAI